ncbi:MAG TPA: 2-C-methyl-D-erythritol 2,4-cyclodiphosphate synthase [Thermomicrobiales bacterium]|nr:2-C-methyl-D-erythritol 2,4-cyclodiphosphate synthase [Thermomicrobiales bacterium]
MSRVGIGYDIHPFAAGRRMVLCGVEFPGEQGLAGHSDADAALHAITDALLGAAGLGDIGEHFPPSDERWRDADSADLLRAVVAQLQSRFTIGNVDLTIVGERPKVGPRRQEMRDRLAALLGISPDRVNVKATTNEQLGALGRGEGLAALAVALLEEREQA